MVRLERGCVRTLLWRRPLTALPVGTQQERLEGDDNIKVTPPPSQMGRRNAAMFFLLTPATAATRRPERAADQIPEAPEDEGA